MKQVYRMALKYGELEIIHDEHSFYLRVLGSINEFANVQLTPVELKQFMCAISRLNAKMGTIEDVTKSLDDY